MTSANKASLVLCGLTALALACDPNVVIGAKWRLGEPPSAGTSAGGSVAGVGASGALGGSSSSGNGGTEVSGDGGTSEPALGGAAGEGQAGDAGGVLFTADHEDGSLAVWDDGPDADAGGYYADAGPPRYSEAQAHSGTGAAEVTIDTSTNTAPIARLYRRVERDNAYYSAWFYLLEDHTPSQWWSIFLFRAVKDRSQSIDLWDVDLVRDGDHLTLSIYDHLRSDVIAVPSKPTIPIAEWFQLEAYLEFGPGKPSRIDYWLDGEPILSLPDLGETPAGEPIYWVIGNGGSLLSPPVSTVYVDDAAVSATRVGAE